MILYEDCQMASKLNLSSQESAGNGAMHILSWRPPAWHCRQCLMAVTSDHSNAQQLKCIASSGDISLLLSRTVLLNADWYYLTYVIQRLTPVRCFNSAIFHTFNFIFSYIVLSFHTYFIISNIFYNFTHIYNSIEYLQSVVKIDNE